MIQAKWTRSGEPRCAPSRQIAGDLLDLSIKHKISLQLIESDKEG